MITHTIVPMVRLSRHARSVKSLGTALLFGAALYGSAAHAQNPAVTVNVDATTSRHAINPNIYGIAYGTPTVLSDLNVVLNRQGGNNTTRYNWQINADNRANDYYYESIGDPSALAGERGDTFISGSKSAGAQSMLTMPMIDWVAKLGPNRNKLASFSVAKYGAQTSTDYWFADAGNGIKSSGGYVTGNDPNDANVPNSVALQQGWVQHLVNQWGPASTGGLRYYLLDNEASIWFGTHRDVAPTGVTMDAMKTKIINYASMIKSVDPSALVVGPEEWGWDGFRFSGYDQQYGAAHNYSSYPDRAAHGNMDYVAYLLDQM
ncbi:MAG: celM, partial [Chthonomonadales bacterium]|nr:celM [Chthonomonadales bacterium]